MREFGCTPTNYYNEGQLEASRMYCPKCGRETAEDAVICPSCGHSIGQTLPLYAPRKTNGKAVASLVLGLVWCLGIGSIIALVLGYGAKREIEDSRGTQEGSGLATAGIVLGWIGVVCMIIYGITMCSALTTL